MLFIENTKKNQSKSFTNSKSFAFLFVIFLCLFFQTSLVRAQVLNSRVQWMLGKQNTFDGPNCLNATAYALGFTPYLTQTSGAELQYYMETSCQRVSVPMAQDVVIINREGTAEHSAIIVNKDIVFEKPSTTGFISVFEDNYESIYKKTAIKDSRYIKDCLSDSRKCELLYYRCQNQTKAIAEIRECEKTDIGQIILKVKSLQQSYAFTQNRDYSLGANKARVEMLALQKHLDKMSLNNKCALYSLTQIESILWQDSSIQYFDTHNKNGWLKGDIMQTSQELINTSEFKANFYEKIESLKSQLKKSTFKKTIRELTQ